MGSETDELRRMLLGIREAWSNVGASVLADHAETWVLSRLAERDARIVELEAALKPFAAVGALRFPVPDGMRDGVYLWRESNSHGPEHGISIADVRRAAEALRPAPDRKEG